MKSILYVASTYGHLERFHQAYIEALQSDGYRVDTLAKGSGSTYDIGFEKKIFSYRNFKYIRRIREIISSKYEVVILNTTLASFFTRLAIKKMKKRPLVINIVHGYLFSERDKLRKLFFLFCEKIVSRISDVVITMNRYDEKMAKKHRLARSVRFIAGLGVFELSAVGASDFDLPTPYILYAAELSKRKNQMALIRLMPDLIKANPELKLVLIGTGNRELALKKEVKKRKLEDRVIFSGFVANPYNYYKNCALYISTSHCEGLPFNIINAMQFEKTVICSDIKGHSDIVANEKNGYLCRGKKEFIATAEKVLKTPVSASFKEKIKQTYAYYSFANQFFRNRKMLEDIIENHDR